MASGALKTVKVLILDGDDILPLLKKSVSILDDSPFGDEDREIIPGVEMHLVMERIWGGLGPYRDHEPRNQGIRELTEGKKVDIVVIGNNDGAGLKKASFVDEALRPRTIVYWFQPNSSLASQYRAMGIEHCEVPRSGLRSAIEDMVRKMVTNGEI